MDFINNPKYKQELEKIQNIDIHSPAYPGFRKNIMDMADILNFIVVEIAKKENRFNPS